MSHESRSSRDAASGVLIGLAAAAVAAVLGLLSEAAVPEEGQDKPQWRTDVCADDTCHTDIISHAVMHRPAARDECLDCHDYEDPWDHLFGLVTEEQELCWECHDLDLEGSVHAPIDEGDCTCCHDSHGSDLPGLLTMHPSRGTCLPCHEDDYSERAFVHGPTAIGDCYACHEPHASAHQALLTNTPTGLCLGCHSEMIPAKPGLAREHEMTDEGCGDCHDAHASDARYLLHSDTTQLCLSCHDDLKETMNGAPVVHGPAVDADGCSTCHKSHFSTEPGLLTMAQADLCLDCHSEPVEAADGRTLADISALLEAYPIHHTPVRDGDCGGCHQPHAGEHANLLIAEYAGAFYVPFDFERYELCFSCHLEELVEDESGTGLTDFRDGDQNLHWLHVNRAKGRNCRVCHEVHASTEPFLMRESVPFGDAGWMLRIDFQATDDGGTCGPGCHESSAYSRSAPQVGAR
jgi:predicted CXXCH cytochrome family protein